MTPRRRMLFGFLLANSCIAMVAALLWWWRPATPPQIQGVLLYEPRQLEPFTLLDTRGHEVGRDSLRGHWTLISYGFTTCPDVCPTTLGELMQFRGQIPPDYSDDLEVLFYSVDYRRDTPEQLRSYLSFFGRNLLGLTASPQHLQGQRAFERSLGIMAEIQPGESGQLDANDYEVLHSVTLLLLNPEGKLQAVFEPDSAGSSLPSFEVGTLLKDYIALRDYFSQNAVDPAHG